MASLGGLPENLRLEVLKRAGSLSDAHRLRMVRRDWWQLPVPAGTQAALQALQRLLTYQKSFGHWSERPVVTVNAADGRAWQVRQQSAFVQVSTGGSNGGSNSGSTSGSNSSGSNSSGSRRIRNLRDTKQTLEYFANTGFTSPIVGFRLSDDQDELVPEEYPLDVAIGGPDLLQPEYERFPTPPAASSALRRLAQLLSFMHDESAHVTVTYVDATDMDITSGRSRGLFNVLDTETDTNHRLDQDAVLSMVAQRPIATISLGGEYDCPDNQFIFFIRFQAPAFANPW